MRVYYLVRPFFILSLLSFFMVVSCRKENNPGKLLSSGSFSHLLVYSDAVQLLDLRSPKDYDAGHLPDAIGMDFSNPDFAAQAAALDTLNPVFIYDAEGKTLAKAASKLYSLHFKKIYELDGGFKAWKEANLQVFSGEANAMEHADPFTDNDLRKILKANPSIIVDCYALWCQPCRMMFPVLKKVEATYGSKIHFFSLNVDSAATLSDEMDLHGMPTLIYYKNGIEIERRVGYQSEADLSKWIDDLLKNKQ